MYYQLEPEVAGGWGKNTEADTNCHPPIVTKLNYEFEGWLGDAIVQSFPCYIVTDKLAESISQSILSGYEFAECEVTKSETFNELYPNKELPKFIWLKIHGKAGVDDFSIGKNLMLVVSEKALSILQAHKLDDCEIEKYNA